MTAAGVSWDGGGVNVAVLSSVAESVELCLFEETGRSGGSPCPSAPGGWHGYVPGVGPGHRYGLRVHGSIDPAGGAWCNPCELLVDVSETLPESAAHRALS